MQNRHIFKIANGKQDVVLRKLTTVFGLPEINRQMGIYMKKVDSPHMEVDLKFKNSTCNISFRNRKLKNSSSNFTVKQGGVRPLIKFLKDSGYEKGTMGEVQIFSFKQNGQPKVDVLLDSFIGDIIYFYGNGNDWRENPAFKNLIKLKIIDPLSKSDIPQIIEKQSLAEYQLMDSVGVLNRDLFDFCRETGIDVVEDLITLKEYIDTHNNDYSMYEDYYKMIVNRDLLGTEVNTKKEFYEPVSIIIPSFNSEATVLKTIESIQSQNLTREQLKKTEIIFVDDGSTTRVEDEIEKHKSKIVTEIKIIRLKENCGLSTARNIGLDAAQNRIILFLDSDMLLSQNYLLEISVRNQIIPNAIFISFKENIEPSSHKASNESIKEGLPMPNIAKDKRISQYLSKDSLGLKKLNRDRNLEILSESNYFKDLSYGRQIGLFDLPSMVVGHNISARKNTVLLAGRFSNEFNGWGLEDSYFGARAIANRNFIIPVLTCGVYHLDHPPRSGSEQKKKKEFQSNLNKYKNLLIRPFERI